MPLTAAITKHCESQSIETCQYYCESINCNLIHRSKKSGKAFFAVFLPDSDGQNYTVNSEGYDQYYTSNCTNLVGTEPTKPTPPIAVSNGKNVLANTPKIGRNQILRQ